MSKPKMCKVCGNKNIANSFFCLCTNCNSKRLKSLKKTKKASQNDNNTFREQLRAADGLLSCKGCGLRADHLDVSHLIPISIRKDLEEDPSNMQMLCRTCHIKWEHKKQGVGNLFCYQDNLTLIRNLDLQYFNRNYGE